MVSKGSAPTVGEGTDMEGPFCLFLERKRENGAGERETKGRGERIEAGETES